MLFILEIEVTVKVKLAVGEVYDMDFEVNELLLTKRSEAKESEISTSTLFKAFKYSTAGLLALKSTTESSGKAGTDGCNVDCAVGFSLDLIIG